MSTTPHELQPRPDTGLTNGQLGLALTLAALVMFLGALVASYVLLRVGAAPGAWPSPGQRGAHPLLPGVPVALGLSLATLLLMARARRRAGGVGGAGAVGTAAAAGGAGRLWGALTVALGGSALGLTALDWQQKLARGHTPAASTFDASFFALSGVATLQLALAVVTLAGLLWRTGARAAEPLRAVRRAELVETLWVFVAVTGVIMQAVLGWL